MAGKFGNFANVKDLTILVFNIQVFRSGEFFKQALYRVVDLWAEVVVPSVD